MRQGGVSARRTAASRRVRPKSRDARARRHLQPKGAPYDTTPGRGNAACFVHNRASMNVAAVLLLVSAGSAAAFAYTASAAEDTNVRITVTHEFTRDDRRDSVQIGPRPRLGATRTTSRGRTQQQILVMDGGEAAITVAEQVPYSEWFWTWGRARGLWVEGEWAQSTSWQQVGASLVVQPEVLSEGRIRVRLTPRFSSFLDRRRGAVDVHELATEVVVREGEEIDVGGVRMSDREFQERFLIGIDRYGTTQRVNIRLKASVD